MNAKPKKKPLVFDINERYLKFGGNQSPTFTSEGLTGKPEKQELRKVEAQIETAIISGFGWSAVSMTGTISGWLYGCSTSEM